MVGNGVNGWNGELMGKCWAGMLGNGGDGGKLKRPGGSGAKSRVVMRSGGQWVMLSNGDIEQWEDGVERGIVGHGRTGTMGPYTNYHNMVGKWWE